LREASLQVSVGEKNHQPQNKLTKNSMTTVNKYSSTEGRFAQSSPVNSKLLQTFS